MGMEPQVPGPGVEHQRKPEGDSQPGSGQFQQGFAGALEQGPVEFAGMLPTYRTEVLRQSERDA